MITAEELVLEISDNEEQKNFKLATVVELFDNDTAKIQFDGEDTPSEKQYAYLDSYVPSIEDRVLLGVLGGTYVILGKVNYNVSPSTEEEIDRYLFDLKQVIIQKGLNVTGPTTLNSGATIVGNVGVNGNVSATGLSATGAVTGANLNVSGEVKGDTLNIANAVTLARLTVTGNHTTTGTLTANSYFNHNGSYLKFFGQSAYTSRKTVNKYITSPIGADPDPKTMQNKLNELIQALQDYGLIGGS